MLWSCPVQRKRILSPRWVVDLQQRGHVEPALHRKPTAMLIAAHWPHRTHEEYRFAFLFRDMPVRLSHRKVTARAALLGEGAA
jgi:hypothetical protein